MCFFYSIKLDYHKITKIHRNITIKTWAFIDFCTNPKTHSGAFDKTFTQIEPMMILPYNFCSYGN